MYETLQPPGAGMPVRRTPKHIKRLSFKNNIRKFLLENTGNYNIP